MRYDRRAERVLVCPAPGDTGYDAGLHGPTLLVIRRPARGKPGTGLFAYACCVISFRIM